MRVNFDWFDRVSTTWRTVIIALAWLCLISWLHYNVNFDRRQRPVMLIGYMPVIANMAAPLLDYASKDGTGLRFEALKFASFAEMGEALRNGSIQAAFIIAPLSIVLHQQGAGVKIVYIGNRHESTLIYKKDLNIKSFADLAGKTIAVPMRFSGHYIAMHRLAEKHSLSDRDLKIVEMNPPDMASALATGALDAYFVGEPFAAKSVHTGAGKVLHCVEDIWPGFICNLGVVRQDLIARDPEWARALVQGAARAGLWACKHTKEAAKIASQYWNQPAELVEYTMCTPPGRIVFDRFVPKIEEIQFLADEMVRLKLMSSNDVCGLVYDRFAKEADLRGVTDLNSILHPPDTSDPH